MIGIVLHDMRWRVLLVAALGTLLYFLEPAFHQHGPVDPQYAGDAGPVGVSATLAYFAALSMIVLLAGFVSTDRREGYAAIHFSHPTTPLAYYGLRWVLAAATTLVGALLFLLLGQAIAWGELRGGWSGMLLAALAVVVYGGLIAFFSTLLRAGDGWVVLLLFLPTPLPAILTWLESIIPPPLDGLLLFLLPPQHALQEVYRGLILGFVAWPPVMFALGYGIFWLTLAALLLRLRPRL